jgi:acetyl esterase/lipase
MPATVRVIRNIEYASYGDRHLLLDVYSPQGFTHPLPGIIVVRGGGWKVGDKEGFSLLAANLAAQGFVTACIEYRVFPEVSFPAPVYDTKAAVRWMRALGAKYGISPNAIGAIGGSAGGHLVTLLGTSGDVPSLEGTGGHPGVSSRVQAVVALAPVVDFETFHPVAYLQFASHPELARQMSPVTYISKTSAPLLLIHGNRDRTVPYTQSQEMLARYQSASAQASLITMDGADHGFWRRHTEDIDTIKEAAKFFHSVLDPLK